MGKETHTVRNYMENNEGIKWKESNTHNITKLTTWLSLVIISPSEPNLQLSDVKSINCQILEMLEKILNLAFKNLKRRQIFLGLHTAFVN